MSLLVRASAVVMLTLAAPTSAAVVCVDASRSSCAATIQQGVDAVTPGDTVELAPRLYLEQVWIGTPGIVLRGSKGVVIDPSGLAAPANAVTIAADDVRLERLTIANGDAAGVVVNAAARPRIVDVEIVSPGGSCIDSSGSADASIEASRLRFCGDWAVRADDADGLALLGNRIEGGGGVSVTGDAIQVAGNSLLRFEGPVFVEGSSTTVTGNRLEHGSGGIWVVGGDALVAHNVLESIWGGIRVAGDDPVIESNELADVRGSGIRAFCDSCDEARIVRNRLRNVSDDGIYIEARGPGTLLEGNRIFQTGSSAIVLEESLGARVASNRVSKAGGVVTGCAEIAGDDNEVVGNSLLACTGDGLIVDGDGNRVEANRVSVTADDGIDVAEGTGNALLSNRVAGASDNGIEVSPDATATVVSDNRAAALRAATATAVAARRAPTRPMPRSAAVKSMTEVSRSLARVRESVLLGVGLGLAIAGSARGAVVCVDPTAASCAATVQQGVDAAAPGDVIEIAAGLYREKVAIATPGITLRGKVGVFIDASGLPEPADAITVAAADVTLESLAIRNGENGIVGTNAAQLRMLRIDIQSSDRYCIKLLGATPRARIESSRIRSCRDWALFVADGDDFQLIGNTIEGVDSSAVRIDGDGVHAERNFYSRIHGDCLAIVGDGASVSRNRFEACQDGVFVGGDDAVVRRNTFSSSVGASISVLGSRLLVESNEVAATGSAGISIRCEAPCAGGRVRDNRLVRVGEVGIRVRPGSSGLAIEGNQIAQTLDVGIEVFDSGVRIEGNRVAGAGSTPRVDCLQIVGDSNRVLGNDLSACSGDGLVLFGQHNEIDGNQISDTGDDGIDVGSGAENVLHGNRVESVSDNGIQVSSPATFTSVSDNQAGGLRAGYCDGGVGTNGSDVPDSTSGCGSIDD
jgi:parallel beta-helix repeat protein